MPDIIPAQAFEDKIKDRLRQDIGSLMPDDVLQQLIVKAINSIFLEPRVSRNSYGSVTDTKPSWFQETVERLLRQQIDKLLNDYVKEHEAELKAKFTEILATKGPELIANWFINVLLGQQQYMIMNIQAWLQNILQNRTP